MVFIFHFLKNAVSVLMWIDHGMQLFCQFSWTSVLNSFFRLLNRNYLLLFLKLNLWTCAVPTPRNNNQGTGASGVGRGEALMDRLSNTATSQALATVPSGALTKPKVVALVDHSPLPSACCWLPKALVPWHVARTVTWAFALPACAPDQPLQWNSIWSTGGIVHHYGRAFPKTPPYDGPGTASLYVFGPPASRPSQAPVGRCLRIGSWRPPACGHLCLLMVSTSSDRLTG